MLSFFIPVAIVLFQLDALDLEVFNVTDEFPSAADSDAITRDTFAHIFKRHNVQLVHGTKANTLLPLIKRTNYSMLNVLDLLSAGSVPMVGELVNGITYCEGVNLKRLDFVAADDRHFIFWDYARSVHPLKVQNELRLSNCSIS
eukprot:708553_1